MEKPGSESIEALVEKHAESDEQQDDGKNHEELDGLGELFNAGDDFALFVGHGIASAIQKDLIVFTNFQSPAIGEKADEYCSNRSPKYQNAQKCAVNRFHGCLPPAGREQCPSADGRAGPSSQLDWGDYAPRTAVVSSRNAVVRELDAPELAGGIKHLEAEFEDAGIFAVGDADDTKFLRFLGNGVEDFDARAEAGFERRADQCATAADGDGFGEGYQGFAVHAVAENLHRDANENARRAAALQHRAGGSHDFVSCSPRAQRSNVVRTLEWVKSS